ncbi:hypothetical protein [Pseudonocardia sp. GCM10023141]|uniref:hypothetical protein n=1 Tax=Pseudonocardia sp. GCM10023141 TaxID=3252653 RepID=UPI00360BF46F
MPDAELHLRQLPDLLRAFDPPVDPRVLALVDEEHGRWRALHDRLVALLVQLLDVASDGRPVTEVITRLIEDTSVGIDDLLDPGAGTGVDAAEIAALLRAHGSLGTVAVDGPVTTFRHACGSGGRHWAANPDVTTVAEGEVPGMPGGRPRYCARCVTSIRAHAGDAWTVAPPEAPGQPCTWTVTNPPPP